MMYWTTLKIVGNFGTSHLIPNIIDQWRRGKNQKIILSHELQILVYKQANKHDCEPSL